MTNNTIRGSDCMRIAVCDDNKVTLDFLCEEIGREFCKTKADFSLDVFENGADFLSQHEKTPFDIVFLDIDMPTINGFEIAERINKNNSSLIVFVTSHDELVYSSFKFQPFRFIRKNHITAELPETVKASAEKYIQRTAARNFEVRTSFGNVFLDLNDVEYIEIYGHWLRINVMNSDAIECYGSLSDFEKRLVPHNFVRTHKSYLVNCKYINSIEQKQVILDDNTVIPLSKYKIETVRNKLRSYLRGMI